MLVAAIALLPAPASAHLNSTGLGPVYDGVAHLFTSPEDLLAVLALALWSGGRGPSHGRQALFALPGAWLLGGLLGMTAPATPGSGLVSAVWLMALGALLAADLTVPLRAAGALAVVLGLQRGYVNGSGLVPVSTGLVAVLGIAAAVFVAVALAAAFAVQLRAAWARIAVRVIGSWIAASGLLFLGWSMRGNR
jgi:urease accessory protein